MKKLLITSMAAVAVSICAKADFTANESFEKDANGQTLAEGPFFEVDETTGKYIYGLDWTSEATPEDGIFTVTNISKIGSYSGDRPLSGENLNALAIDTEKSLIRRVIPGASSTDLEGASLEGGPIFFDSVVQFTATETAPETTGAKLVAWLYKTEELADGEKGLFGETDPISKLVITALYDGDEGYFKTNYLTDVTIQPESWHRLTIKSFVENTELKFEVKVDGNIVTVNGVQVPFISLDELGTTDRTLKGVAFEGKGAVDDLVFTTTDPFAGGGGEEPDPEPEQKYYKLDIVGDYFTYVVYEDSVWEYTVDTTKIEVAKKTLWLEIKPEEDYELESIKLGDTFVTPLPVYSEDDGSYALDELEISNGDIENGAVFTLTIQMKKKPSSGGDVTVGDTTVQIGDDGKITNITTAFNGMTVSGNLDTSKFKDYYVVSVDNGVLSIKLNQKVAAPFAEELAEGEEVLELDTTIGEGESAVPAVGVRIKTYPGLWYGLGTATELGKWGQLGADDWVPGNGSKLQLKAAKPAGNAAFFMIQVRDTDPAAE